MAKQEQIFSKSEGNRWFERNKKALLGFDPEADFVLKLMRMYSIKPSRVAEIGCANGYRLAQIQREFGARVLGVEISEGALQDGAERYPEIVLKRGSITDIPLDETFDLVIVNFVFHWVDRSLLLKAVSEVDRLVSPDGLLILGDFLPQNPARTPYSHLEEEGVFTFKQNYSLPFVSSGLYHVAGLITGKQPPRDISADVSDYDRTGTWLLKKSGLSA